MQPKGLCKNCPTCLDNFAQISANKAVVFFLAFLCPGHLECCCGKYSRLDICPIPAKVTRRSWNLSQVEEGWIHPKTALALCMKIYVLHKRMPKIK